jgi:signal transduction histidine kinase
LKRKTKGLKYQNWLHLMAFSLIILVVLGALQFLFLGRFYQSMKLNEIKKIGDKIADKFNQEDMYSIMGEYAFARNLRIVLLDEGGRVTGHFDGFPQEGFGRPQGGGLGVFPAASLSLALEKLEKSGSDRTHYLDKNERLNSSQSVFIARAADRGGQVYYLYISSPVPPIDATVSALKQQFIIITAILLFLSLVTAQWMSKKMSQPLIRLTESAGRLVKGELDAVFSEEGYTEIRQLASALNYAVGEIRSLDIYRRELIANVSHDLKTPLTIIKFYGEMVRDVSGDNPEKRNEHCATIIREADWLAGMVEEILELSKLEGGNADITKEEVNLSRCLEDTLKSFQALADKDGYVFTADLEEGMYVLGNEPMLRRVLYNLIGNAVNFTGEDKRVAISLKSTGNLIRFTVSDSGKGIPEKSRNAIWDRYYKSGETHKRAVVGFGLGLAIVKNILILHGAQYGVDSERGGGSSFWFSLEKVAPSLPEAKKE